MHLSEDIKPISFLKSKTAEAVHLVRENRRPMIITQNGEAKAVIQDLESYEAQRDALTLLKLIVQSEQELERGEGKSQAEVFDMLKNEVSGK
jgi:prevent-host-death family protein